MKQNKKIQWLLSIPLLLPSTILLTNCAYNDQTNNNNNNGNNNNSENIKPPVISDKLSKIKINTKNGDSSFATERKDIFVGENYNTFSKPSFEYQQSTITLEDENNNKVIANLDAQVKVRGNTTTLYDKKPFRIKFNEKQTMFGLNSNYASKDWVLLADWLDCSMLRNNVGFYLGHLLYKPIGEYSSDFMNVELYINDQYWGIYLLCEQNEVSKGRVNINKPEENYTSTDIGYLVEYDTYANFEKELEKFQLNYNNKAELTINATDVNKKTVTFKVDEYAIKSKVYSQDQKNTIQNYLDNIYKICYEALINKKYFEFNTDRTNIVESKTILDAYTAVSNVVDIDSTVAMIILQEIVFDYDVDNSSFYMYVDLSQNGDKKLHFTAPWDFDNALGNRNDYGKKIFADKLYAVNSDNPWVVLLYKLEKIQNQIKQRWLKFNSDSSKDKIFNLIDEYMTKYVEYYKQNYDKWGNIGQNIVKEYDKLSEEDKKNPNIDGNWGTLRYNNEPGGTIDVETQSGAADYLKTWLKTRFDVLDKAWL
ncbi:CotH kinase family protein [Malacoplasma muris]|uniref:CotH kinase family protein n=1 Tax=Malacoplasma muris TaxID=2119 RepID=UPI00398F5E5B